MAQPIKTILCYGDSNTWGYAPASGDRYPRDVRWTGVLARELGEKFEVIAEGLNGRTTVWDDPVEEDKNGAAQLIPTITSHKPLDLVIIMLGTNDLKQRFSVHAADIAKSAALLANKVMRSDTGPVGAAPQVLLVAPPPVVSAERYADFFVGAENKSAQFDRYFRAAAAEVGCAFFDAASVVQSSALDGIHLDPESHQALGEALARKSLELLA